MDLISIGDVLSFPGNNTEWFCLPPDKNNWTLYTKGVFTLDARDFPPDSDEYLPKQVKNDGWIEVLDGVPEEKIGILRKKSERFYKKISKC